MDRRISHLSLIRQMLFLSGGIMFAFFDMKLSHISRLSTGHVYIDATANCVFHKSCWCNTLKCPDVFYVYHDHLYCILGLGQKY